MVVFDATALIYLFDPKTKAPIDEMTGTAVTHVQERIEFIIRELNKRNEKIIVPTPALSELLVRAGEAGPEYLEKLGKSAVFKIVGFDQRAAIEVAATTREAIDAGNKRGGSSGVWSKVKFDRQIIAIAKVEGASRIYSDDDDIYRLLKNSEIDVVRICDLPLPPEEAQKKLDFSSQN